MSRSLLPVLPAVLSLALLGAPSGASAATFCVGEATGCTGTAAASVQQALDLAAAAPGRDRVEVGSVVDPGDNAPHGGFTIAAGNAVDLVGVNVPLLQLGGADAITIAEPSATVSGFQVFVFEPAPAIPIDLVAGTIDGVEVYSTTATPVVRLGAGTLRHVRFPLADHGSVAVRAVGPGGLIERSTLFAPTALESSSDALVVRRTLVEGIGDDPGGAGMRVTAGSVSLQDVVLAMDGDAAGTTALDVAPGAGTATVAMRGVTVTGLGEALLSTGVRAACTGGGTAAVTFTDSVATGFATDLARSGPGCTVDLDHARYGTRDAGGGSFGDGPGVTTGPVGAFGGLVAPGFDSPLIDAGTPGPSSEPEYLAEPRVADGDGDGAAVRDIGAIEYQRRPPIAALEVDPQVETGEDALLDAYGSGDPDLGDEGRLSFAWTVDGTAVAADPDVPDELFHTFTADGPHTASVTVTDPTGQSATATAAFRSVTTPPEAPSAPRLPPPATSTLPRVPSPPPAAIAPQLPAAPPPVLARLLSTRVVGRALRVRVTCRPRTCTGTIVLRAADARGTVRLGSVRYRVAHGAPRTVKVPLGRAALRAIARAGRRGVFVNVEIHGTRQAWTSGEGGRVRP